MKSVFVWLLFSLFGSLGFATDQPLWLRYPSISPDGNSVVFTYKGDLFKVSSNGGEATALTFYDGQDFMPTWSPDGSQIAFASDRFGNFDVYVMPSNGGEAKRLTFHSSNDYPYTFAPDQQSILFGATRMDDVKNSMFPSGNLPELYRVTLTGGEPDQVLTIPAQDVRFSPDGGSIIFHDKKGYEDPWRKHHTSSITRDIWSYTFSNNQYQQLTQRAGEDRNPNFSADGKSIYFLREAGGAFNVFKMDPANPNAATQLTRYSDHPVRFLTVSKTGVLCFSYDGELYTMTEGSQPRKLAVTIRRDHQNKNEQRLKVSSGATEMVVSPNGKEVAFIKRGEVFVTSVESGTTKQITFTPEQERNLSFHPEGKTLLYASERNQSWNLYQAKISREKEKYFFNATLIDEKPLLESAAETFQPQYSPDGKEVAYIEDRTAIKVITIASGAIRQVMAKEMSFSYADGDQHFRWSPDGKWILSIFLPPGFYSYEVGLFPTDGKGKMVNLTRSGFGDGGPKWMMDGKMMLWFSNRDGLRSAARTGGTQNDAYGMFFTQEDYDRFRLSKEELELLKEQEEADKPKPEEDDKKDEKKAKKSKKKTSDKDKDKKDKKDKEKEKVKPVKIEFDGLQDRKVRLTIFSSRLSDAVVTPDGEKLIYLANLGEGFDLWVTELRTKETKVLTKLGSSGGSLTLSKDGKEVFLLSRGNMSKITIASGKRKGIGYSSQMVLNKSAERAYLFEHVWRQVREKFYKKDLHGAKWDTMKTAYSRFLPHINNNYDFAELLAELLGELNASHTGARYRHRDSEGDRTASLGAFYDQSHTGNGLKIAELLPRSPLGKSNSKIRPGHIIEKIDGTTITPAVNVAKLLNHKAGKNTLLTVKDDKGTVYEEVVKPISFGAQFGARYEHWVNQRKKMTEELSGGKIGYVHVRSMGDGSYRTVIEEVLGEQVDKQAVVIDTRFNGGGDLVDDLSIFLSGKTYMDFVTNDNRTIGHEPGLRWQRPSIVLVGEGNYSDAHCFPWAYSHLGIGKVVGMPVPGTCTFVWWEGLQDSSLVFGIPNLAVTSETGTVLENSQLEPDIKVRNDFEQVTQGRDQQLERAVKELLAELGN